MRKLTVFLFAATAMLAAPAASAQDDLDGLEMDVMDEQGTPNDASTKVLALPDDASDTAREHAQRGLDTANAAREDGAGFGTDTADAARDGRGAPEGTPDGRPEGLPTGP
jgi:hypothetical protein